MVKVTNENVTKLSEDTLFLVMNELSEKDPTYILIDAELDRRIHLREEKLKAAHNREMESLRATQLVREQIQSIFAGIKGKKTLVLIQNLGQDFVDDYVIDETTFTVFSKVRHPIFDRPSSWECETMDQARTKVARLIYYRIYERFMRDPSETNLQLVRRILE